MIKKKLLIGYLKRYWRSLEANNVIIDIEFNESDDLYARLTKITNVIEAMHPDLQIIIVGITDIDKNLF